MECFLKIETHAGIVNLKIQSTALNLLDLDFFVISDYRLIGA